MSSNGPKQPDEPEALAHRWAVRSNDGLNVVSVVTVGVILAGTLATYDHGPFHWILIGVLGIFFVRGVAGLIRPRDYELTLRDGVLYWGWAHKEARKTLRLGEVEELRWDDAELMVRLRGQRRASNSRKGLSSVLGPAHHRVSFARTLRALHPDVSVGGLVDGQLAETTSH